MIITSISALIIFFASDVIVGLLNSPELKKTLWLIPVSVLVSGTFSALNYWNSRTKHFGRLSIARLISSVFAQSTILGAGYAGFVSSGVLIGPVFWVKFFLHHFSAVRYGRMIVIYSKQVSDGKK